MIAKSKALQIISYIIGAINCNHISLTNPKLDPSSYCYCKGFYSIILYEVVGSKCKFWDYNFECLGHSHDWHYFNKLKLEKNAFLS